MSEEEDPIELDPDEAEEAERGGKRGPKKARFVIENNNNGDVVRLRARLEVKIQRVIDRMYAEFERTHQPGDRLTRTPDGSDVFASAQLTVEEYLDGAPDRKRVHWAFVGDQGGAAE